MKEMNTTRFRSATIVVCALLLGGCSRTNDPDLQAQPPPQQSEAVTASVPKPPSPFRQANTLGVRFEFEIAGKRFAEGEPIVVTVHAVNPTGRDIELKPESLYPSLFDFGIWDNGQPLQYSVNMAMNPGDKTVAIPANSRILWAKEDVVANTMAFGGKPSSLRIPGAHKVMFVFGDRRHVIEFVVEKREEMPNQAVDGDKK